jgi:CSLREA domain-containing protein
MKRHVLMLVAVLLACSRAVAAPFVVTTTADGGDTVIDGACAASGGQCTLRAAIQEANATPEADTITVPAGTYELTVADAEDGVADLDLAFPVTITGAGPLATVVDATGGPGVLEVRASATLEGLTIRGADVFAEGGGVYAVGDPTPLELTIRDAQITGNRAIHGGGLYVDGGSTVLLERVSITGNTGTTRGGAITVGIEFGGGSVSIQNATVSGNTSGIQGDVVNEDELQLAHTTVVGDTIATAAAPATTTLAASVLDAGVGATVCVNPVVSQGSNVEHGTSCGLAMPGDASGGDPMLGPLQDNGGGTLTHALGAGSPAIDVAGVCALAEDQRGAPRPLDGDGDGTAECDAGAYEVDPSELPTTTSTTSTPSATSTSTTLPGGCPGEATFAAVRCRLAALGARIGAAGTGALRDRLVASLGKAGDRVDAAEATSGTSAKKAKKLLKKAAVLLKKARAKIGSKKGQKTFVDATERGALQSDADGVRNAILTLVSSLG